MRAVRSHFGDQRKNVALQAERHVVAQFGNRQQPPRVFGKADPPSNPISLSPEDTRFVRDPMLVPADLR